jgi:hypothetical protein
LDSFVVKWCFLLVDLGVDANKELEEGDFSFLSLQAQQLLEWAELGLES